MRFFVAIALFFLLLPSPVWADQLKDGMTAFGHKDYQLAFDLWRPMAEGGDAAAEDKLCLLYRYGLGVKTDNREAAAWCRKASLQGNANAQFWLGVMYEKGDGVTQDSGEALKWLRKAADQGYAIAAFNAATLYQDGLGVAQSWTEAYFWYSLAAKSSGGKSPWPPEHALENAGRHLGAREMKAVKKRVADWKPLLPPAPPQQPPARGEALRN